MIAVEKKTKLMYFTVNAYKWVGLLTPSSPD